jgi:(1->4)-alpha-D-glucan 1-alpha-D-glucosylmutase
MKNPDTLARLAALYGITSEYHDMRGRLHITEEAAQRTLLTAMGVDLDGDLSVILAEYEARPWRNLLPPVLVAYSAKSGLAVPVTFPSALAGNTYHWLLTREDGGREQGWFQPSRLEAVGNHQIDGEPYERGLLRLPTCPEPGYHQLTVRAPDRTETRMTLIVAPTTSPRR